MSHQLTKAAAVVIQVRHYLPRLPAQSHTPIPLSRILGSMPHFPSVIHGDYVMLCCRHALLVLYSCFAHALFMLCSCLICALQGIVGATFGRRLLDLVGVKNNVARGVAIGLFFNTLFL